MPSIGLGTWPLDDAQAGAAVVHGLEAGYRLIDTAENYNNETGIGEGIGSTSVPREELFITSKFNVKWHSVDGVRDAWEHSCTRLGVEYLDLFLIHWPNPAQGRYVEAWEGLVKLLKAGRVRAIGTSNFTTEQLQELIHATGVVPDVNQIQHSPYWIDDERLAFHAGHGIVTEAWGPLGRGKHNLLEAEPVVAAAHAHKVTPAQAVLALARAARRGSHPQERGPRAHGAEPRRVFVRPDPGAGPGDRCAERDRRRARVPDGVRALDAPGACRQAPT